MTEERLDLLIFGATGYTGKIAVQKAAQLCPKTKFSWGIAGRRQEALEAVAKETVPDQDIPIVIADVNDEESLKKMARRTKVLVNCCGPYRFYGEQVVKACIEAGTHHVDVSAEPQFNERMQLEYDHEAKDAGVYIISSCGFVSIPCDMGVIFTQNKFQGEVNSIESYLTVKSGIKHSGAIAHYGTLKSVVWRLVHLNELHALRKKLYTDKLPELEPKLEPRRIVHRSPISNKWSTIFPGSDRSVVARTQRFFFNRYKQRPAQLRTYISFDSLFALLVIIFGAAINILLLNFSYGRAFLLKHPKFCTGGFVSHEGPEREIRENLQFDVTFKASGWTEKLSEPTDKHSDPPNKEMITKVSGVDPGYGLTSVMLLISALTILREADKMPDNGGVISPGAAFAKTSIVDELNKHGLKFEVLSSIEK